MNLLPKILPQNDKQRRADVERQLIRQEAVIGGRLFGRLPKDRHREFFCLDAHTWVWHEEWQANGQRQVVTTRYTVRPDGILKSQNGQPYQAVTRDEARNLYQAAQMYWHRISDHYQRQLQSA
jgi:hypothetical protein